ncbi:MAG TPA: type II/IV secretion system protein [Thermoanaerobaculia bacterium]|nr:type II/IV secretion system protein [Thermoanaerobaculia bacterium]
MATEPHPEFTELAQFVIDERSVRMLERGYCLENDVVVLGVVDRTNREPVTVGMLDPSRRALVHEVSRTLGRPVKAVRLNAWEIRRALDQGHGIAEENRSRLTLRPIRDISFERAGEVPEILDEILGRAVELGASDVHVETYEEDVDVRFRIDGVLRQVATPLSRDNIQGVVNRLKVLSGLDLAERRRAQDGRIQATFQVGRHAPANTREVDFRLSVVPGPFGEDAVLRILDSAAPLPLEKLGLDDAELATFERLIENPEGLLLVTGPTGSGKTTTLYAALHRINSPENKILTVEDPIEYHFPKTNQKQVSGNMGFADYARAFMRQNPDIILIGEIRDEDTASAAVRASQTGHLVLSTLHTTDAVRTISRLVTLGVDPGMIAGCLLGAMSQRLVRKLCPQCRVEAEPGSREAQRLGLSDGSFYRSQPAPDCPVCGGTGYKGRIGIYELFVLDSELADLVAEKAPVHQIRSAALDKGMKTLFDDAARKARLGLTSLDEILRTVPYRILEGK